MALRICLVTPFAWSQPHDVNEHVAGIARELRALGHAVTIIASSNRAADLAAGRVALHNGSFDGDELVVLGPAVPISRRSRVGVPVGVRTNLSRALRFGRFDVVHGFEPGLPSLSYLALRDAESLAVATFFSPERLSYPPGRAQRERLLGRIDQLLAVSEGDGHRGGRTLPGRVPARLRGRRHDAVRAGGEGAAHRARVAADRAPADASRPAHARRASRLAADAAPHEAAHDAAVRPADARRPRRREDGTRLAEPRHDPQRRGDLRPRGRGNLAARDSRPQQRAPPSRRRPACTSSRSSPRPRWVASPTTRPIAYGARAGARGEAERQTFTDVAHELEEIYQDVRTRKRSARRDTEPLGDRNWIVVDLHMHTSASHDCRVAPELLLEHALAEGLGAIAITDHNVFSGAQEVVELARGRDIVVIPGEEVKTDGQGEVIGLFLKEEIPRGMSFGDTIAAIKAQGGLVYLPHPFDRMHAIPDAATLHGHLSQIDVFEVYNARLLFETYNDEALRFARKYNLTMGAGSDAHVLQGLGTGAVRMRAFDGPEEFLLSLRTAEILRRPKSLLYLQSLKWAAQAKERVR